MISFAGLFEGKRPNDCHLTTAVLDPNQFRVMCGTTIPSLSQFNFTDKQPLSTSNAVATPITALSINSNFGVVGTQGGTIFVWDINSNKYLAKMSGHLT